MKTKLASKEPRDRDDEMFKPWSPSKYGQKKSDWPVKRSKHCNQGKRKKKR